LSNQGAEQVYYDNLAVTLTPEHYSKRNTIIPMACPYKAGVRPPAVPYPTGSATRAMNTEKRQGLTGWISITGSLACPEFIEGIPKGQVPGLRCFGRYTGQQYI